MINFYITLAVLAAVGFVPNTKTKHHGARVWIAGATVYCRNFATGEKIANRVIEALRKRGINPAYEVVDQFDARKSNF